MLRSKTMMLARQACVCCGEAGGCTCDTCTDCGELEQFLQFEGISPRGEHFLFAGALCDGCAMVEMDICSACEEVHDDCTCGLEISDPEQLGRSL